MSDTVFTKVDYDLGSLIKYIGLGEIGLPDIQRPFVWTNAKVRDLFDSMYKGYPVGYFLFWQNALASDRAIGTDDKQKPSRLVIVDGQQRMTSLYAVVKGVPVVRANYMSERIYIAFNPLEEKFEVADAAIRRNKAFFPDISTLWNDSTNIFTITQEYLNGLQATRELTTEDINKIQNSIIKLQGLLSFPFTALELATDIPEDSVSDVFVRINSKGTPLKQADFILTLMSVFWDDGRTELETFCRESRIPSKTGPSPFNHFIEPTPAQLLRVDVGLAFKRARLKYVYSILRGKDLETEKFSEERRDAQFQVLKDAQSKVLDLQNWHDFMNCIRLAGYRSGKMISSENNLLFSYMLYLIGKTEYNIDKFELRKAIARWFYMSSVTARYTSSPESAMEFDLARFRGVTDGREFLTILKKVSDTTLTSDFWSVTLPSDLATSAPKSPSLCAYNAALVLLDAPALYSKIKIGDLLDPSIQAHRAMAERHHLFPKGHLRALGLTSTRDTNQIANYAYVEWGDNNDISAKSPSQYVPGMEARFSNDELTQMHHWHALPENWQSLDYNNFLEQRRELIAAVVAEGYQALIEDGTGREEAEAIDLSQLVINGESEAVEFKSTLRTNLHTGKKDPRMEHAILKTIAGFLNTNGGTLVIGVADDGEAVGIGEDGFANEDKFHLHLTNMINDKIGPKIMTWLNAHFEDYNGSRVMMVRCNKGAAPAYVKEGNTDHFYIRTGPSSTALSASQIQDYIKQRF